MHGVWNILNALCACAIELGSVHLFQNVRWREFVGRL